jgi:hypothetical protein
MKVNSGDLELGYRMILLKYNGQSSTPSSSITTVLALNESERITIEILKKTLEEIQQLQAKYKNFEFKNSIKASVLLKDIPSMEIKLSKVQKDGWEISPEGNSFRDYIKSGTLQKDYDVLLEELRSRDANAAIYDMKDIWKKQTGQELPIEYDMIKSKPSSCKITQQYVTTPSELQGMVHKQTKYTPPVSNKYRESSTTNTTGKKCPDMRNYVHKSKLPDMSQYIRKDSIPCWACKL